MTQSNNCICLYLFILENCMNSYNKCYSGVANVFFFLSKWFTTYSSFTPITIYWLHFPQACTSTHVEHTHSSFLPCLFLLRNQLCVKTSQTVLQKKREFTKHPNVHPSTTGLFTRTKIAPNMLMYTKNNGPKLQSVNINVGCHETHFLSGWSSLRVNRPYGWRIIRFRTISIPYRLEFWNIQTYACHWIFEVRNYWGNYKFRINTAKVVVLQFKVTDIFKQLIFPIYVGTVYWATNYYLASLHGWSIVNMT